MPAFENAVGLGYRYLETDVHVTADGVLLAFHDDHLDRVTDRTGEIADLPCAEVAEARVDGREPIPLLEDLLGAFPDARINIDPKHDGVGRAPGRGAAAHRTPSTGCASARSPTPASGRSAAAWARRCARRSGPRRGRPPPPRRPRRAAVRPTATGCVQVPERFRGVTVDRRAPSSGPPTGPGLQVHVWTVDDPAEMHRLLDLGVDGIMTDRPAVLKEVLGRSDQSARWWVEGPRRAGQAGRRG